MHSAAWIELLRLLPPALRENLALTTLNGTEIALQSIVRAERDYLVLRGRLTGTTDGNGFFIIPFDRLSHLTLQKSVTEPEVRALFDSPADSSPSGPSASADVNVLGPATANHKAAGIDPSPSPSPGQSGPGDGAKAPGVDKAALLERLRNRRPTLASVKPGKA
jgi:hypothetical protein